MRICILSMQRVDNMGSVLQAFGLKKIVETIGHEVEFIDIVRIEEDYKMLNEFTQDFSAELEKKGDCKFGWKIRYGFFNRVKNKGLESKQKKMFEKFRLTQLELNKVSEKYDICIIGSDEVFNCLNSGSWGFTSQLFGNIPQAKKIITYAASCGSTIYEELPYDVVNKIQETFKRVSFFSVRDKNTLDFVNRLTNKNIVENFDPVLISNFDTEMVGEEDININEPYCIVYSYKNRINDKKEISAIMEICRSKGLRILAIGAAQFWIKDFIVCSPFQCLNLFKRAAFVITDTFHGTIFSAKYSRKFAIIIRDSNKNKLGDLVKKLQLEEHVLEDIGELGSVNLVNKNNERIKQIIEVEKIKSVNYLESFLCNSNGSRD